MTTTPRTKTEKQDVPALPENVATISNTTTSTPRLAHGRVSFDDGAIAPEKSTRVDLGFRPTHVRWVNPADRVEVEWLNGMDANTCLKTGADGARTLEADAGGITVDDRGFSIAHSEKLGAVVPSKTCVYEARG